MQYAQAVRYLYYFLNFECLPFEYKRQFHLKRMACLLDWFGHPEYSFSSILVAGTKGKGSTANFLASILTANRYSTGLYTSPHLGDPRERIRVDGRAISKNDFAQLFSKIKQVMPGLGFIKVSPPRKRGSSTLDSRRSDRSVPDDRAADRRLTDWRFRGNDIGLMKSIPGIGKALGPITYFEVFTLAAMLYFKERKVDFGIFEVGMGGRLDATNVLKPLVSVITPISFDHEEHLGHSLTSIAREKAAIVKPSAVVVSSEQKPEARRVIQDQIRRQKARGYFLDSAFRTQHETTSLKGGKFDFQIGPRRWKGFRISLVGRFQIRNAAVALAGASLLENQFGFPLRESMIRKGLKTAFWPGRFEVLRRGPKTFVLDGAHNGASMREVSIALKTFFPKRKKIAIFGVSREKNLQAILKNLIPDFVSFIVTKSNTSRAQEPKVILETLSKMGYKKPTFWAQSIREALRIVDQLAPPSPLSSPPSATKMADPSFGGKGGRGRGEGVILITGSLFLV
ncbi:MAG: bifunctional folylpolyglutamate synthase/dihydrofolate synthase, partial [Candidatus Omnitrophica bacterium]|nr:bifunctional folylpolyglutamate synthase/dihydrofolate synthase [Candidatus Omnitrophota bacterium]